MFSKDQRELHYILKPFCVFVPLLSRYLLNVLRRYFQTLVSNVVLLTPQLNPVVISKHTQKNQNLTPNYSALSNCMRTKLHLSTAVISSTVTHDNHFNTKQ